MTTPTDLPLIHRHTWTLLLLIALMVTLFACVLSVVIKEAVQQESELMQ